MGVVYEAHDSQLHRSVALNVAQALQGSDRRQAIERFQREAKAAASLLHPNIVQIYDTGVEQGMNYIVMELCSGTTLRDVLHFEHHLQEARVRTIASYVEDNSGTAVFRRYKEYRASFHTVNYDVPPLRMGDH